MDTKIKPLEELTIMDDYMFGVVMCDKNNLKPLLEYILKVNIVEIDFIERQKTEKEGYESHGVRLDLYVKDGHGRVFNVEVQTSDKKNLPKRMRYYQGVIDVELLSPGANYNDLGKCFILFICNYDPFGLGRSIYTFENRCLEEPDLSFGDETVKVIANTKGKVGEISEELKELFLYFDEGIATGAYTRQLDDAVKNVKSSEERRHEYMVMMIREMEAKEEGRAEGRAEGRSEGIDQNRVESIKNIMDGLKYSAQQAMDLLKIPAAEQDKYLAKL
jgi:predicted transposase/invertase (TIGR01784 family)